MYVNIVDVLLDSYSDEDAVFDDCITYLIGGSHTTTFSMYNNMSYLLLLSRASLSLFAKNRKFIRIACSRISKMVEALVLNYTEIFGLLHILSFHQFHGNKEQKSPTK